MPYFAVKQPYSDLILYYPIEIVANDTMSFCDVKEQYLGIILLYYEGEMKYPDIEIQNIGVKMSYLTSNGPILYFAIFW